MTSPSEQPRSCDIAVLGTGLMGSALVRTLADAGNDVAVWNRTYERAAALASDRVRPIRSIQDVIRAAPVTVACLSTYEALWSALDGTDARGAALVNLASGTPERAEDFAAWALANDVEYLDGAILAFPDFISSPDAIIAYSGSSRVWENFSQLLVTLGGQSQWIGQAVGAANVLDSAMIISFYTTAITSYVEAATYALDHGVPEDLLRASTRLVLRTLGHSTKEATAAITSGEYATDQATLSTYATGTRAVLESMRNAGMPARLLAATVQSLEAACDADLGRSGIYAQAEITRARPRTS